MLIILMGIIIIFLMIVFLEKLALFVAGVDLAGRAEMWKIMMQSIREHPFLGIGFANSTKYLLGDISTGSTVGSHNSYLNILCENGILGFAVFIIMNIYIGLTVCRKWNVATDNFLCKIATTIFLVYIPYAFIENAYMIVEGRSYLWLLVCVYIERIARNHRYTNMLCDAQFF